MFRAVEKKADLDGTADAGMIRDVRVELAKSTPFSRAGELLKKFGDPEFEPYRAAYSNGMNVSTLCEILDPSGQHENTTLDAFERVLRAAGVRMQTDHARGIFASSLAEMEQDLGTKRLVPELLSRMYRSAVHGNGGSENRASPVFLSSDYISGSIQRPYAQRPGVFQPPITAAIPISSLVAITTGIEGDAYRGFFIDYDAEASRMKRVTEAAELPRTRIKGRTQAVNLYKFGRAIEMSYEVLRRMAIDMVAVIIQMMAAQAEADKLQEVIDVLIAGDGNSNAITTVNLTTLDPAAVAGTLTLKAWTNFHMEFESPYTLGVIIAQKAMASQVLLLNTGNANLPLSSFAAITGFGGVRPLNRTNDNVGLAWTSGAPALKLLGVDTSKALERVYEIGASISEVDRFITRQVEVLTLSEQEGYAILDKNARKVLDINA